MQYSLVLQILIRVVRIRIKLGINIRIQILTETFKIKLFQAQNKCLDHVHRQRVIYPNRVSDRIIKN